MRVLYAAPLDRAFRSDFSVAMQNALLDLQVWYHQLLNGRTFSLFSAAPELCQLNQTADFYRIDTWSKIVNGVQQCAPVSPFTSTFDWVVYADVDHECNAPGRIGAALQGLTILPRADLNGLVGEPVVDDCGIPQNSPITRWIGGLGHELGHTFGVPHPPGCDAGLPTCDSGSLMRLGFYSYPNAYFNSGEKQILMSSPFILPLDVGCPSSITPTSQSFIRTGGTATVAVGTLSSCAWTAVSNDAWISVTGGASGTGNGTVSYAVAANATTSQRSGTMTIAGQTFTATQVGQFTDHPLVAGSTTVRAVHFQELRDRIDLLRAARSLAAFAWTDPVLTATTTVIIAEHMQELRTALQAVYTADGLASPTYTNQIAGGTILRAVDITELRVAIVDVEETIAPTLAVVMSWQWQLTTPVDLSVNAAMYDIDLFENTAATVAALHGAGRYVVCYISVGSWENFRPDASDFPPEVIGNVYEGFPDERWLDIRQIDQLAPILRSRLDDCAAKGFDGVEPDNIDGYQNNTGFPISAADQLLFNRWLANEAHTRGLSIGLKNDPDQVGQLIADFDWGLTEDCFIDGFCGMFTPFVAAGKPVFAAEYTDRWQSAGFCDQANGLDFNAILKNPDLDVFRVACR